MLAAVLHTRAEVRRSTARPGQSSDGAGSGPRPGNGRPWQAGGAGEAEASPAAAHVSYSSDVLEVVEEYVYRPLQRPFLFLVRLAQRLQSGRLEAYLAYMLIALIAVLAVVTAVH